MKGDKKNPALLPQAEGAHLGQTEGDLALKLAKEGARTIPPREHGRFP
jgi:formamidase